jgi:polyhydroxybutyrate depolymerase
MKYRILITATLMVLCATLITRWTFRSHGAAIMDDCATLENHKKGLERARARLQRDLQKATGPDKQSLIQQIKELDSEIKADQDELYRRECEGVPMHWTVSGEQREALVFAHSINTAEKRPLVFAFHWHGGSMEAAAEKMSIHTKWPEAIVVYPQGLPRKRPKESSCGNNDLAGNHPGWQVKANQLVGDVGNKDLEFFDAMLETMRQKYNVDDQRIYATGFSNGAVFSYLLWAERGKTIAAIGEVAGRLWQTENLKERRPILAITGTSDTTVPFNCQFASIETAKHFDNATTSNEPCPAPNEADPAAPSPKCTLYPSTTHTPVKTFIHDGGHHYPTWAPDEIVTFFKSHKLS